MKYPVFFCSFNPSSLCLVCQSNLSWMLDKQPAAFSSRTTIHGDLRYACPPTHTLWSSWCINFYVQVSLQLFIQITETVTYFVLFVSRNQRSIVQRKSLKQKMMKTSVMRAAHWKKCLPCMKMLMKLMTCGSSSWTC